MILEIIKSVAVLIACVGLYIVLIPLIKNEVVGFIQSIVSIVKFLEILFVSAVAGLGSAALLRSFVYKEGFRYYILVGIGVCGFLLFLLFKSCFLGYIPYLTFICNLLLGVGMGVFIGSCIVSGILDNKYDSIPIWMYIATYGGSIVVTLILYRVSLFTNVSGVELPHEWRDRHGMWDI